MAARPATSIAHAGIEQPEREVEHRVARRDEGAVVLTREKAGVDELTDEPAGSASQPHMDLGECHGRSRIIGPTRAQGLIDSQPFAHGRALADAAQERLDRFELEASLLEFGDELQPFEVSGVVARVAPVAAWPDQDALGLVVPDGSGTHARTLGQLVEAEFSVHDPSFPQL